MPSGDPVAAAVSRIAEVPDGHDERGVAPTDDPDPGIVPTDLRGVGSGTAAIIKGSTFDAADIVERNVSYTMLLDAGVNRRVADDLRREYSLVWSFYWTDGSDLRHRAAELRGLGEAEREWIAASVSDDDRRGDAADGVRVVDDDRPDPVAPGVDSGDPGEDAHGSDACPRCDTELSTYSFGGRETTACETCGYTGVDVG